MTDSENQPSKEEAEERLFTLVELEEWLRTPMLVLSAVWLALVVAELALGVSRLLETLGSVIWMIFLAEFALRLWLAPDKAVFLRTNWLSVIALVAPAFRLLRGFRLLRAARAARGLRLVRVVGTANRTMNALRATMHRRGLGYVLALTTLVNLLGAAGMYAFERAPEVEGGFTSFGDALWWTAMLLSTMGSAYWPVTAEGRVLCLLLAVYAFAVFGYITAAFASFFVGRDAEARGDKRT
ncbi:ion transporter [Falsiroseomonas sp. E2-1-a20]|uniref:ion transporter n=1 Tax=Falsiroseomonas sp. E2-1-a20 TaxID=3239300 RepID=UPI003F39C17E